jgi:hypothetical protein
MKGNVDYELTADEVKAVVARAVFQATGLGAAHVSAQDVELLKDADGNFAGARVAKKDLSWSLSGRG